MLAVLECKHTHEESNRVEREEDEINVEYLSTINPKNR